MRDSEQVTPSTTAFGLTGSARSHNHRFLNVALGTFVLGRVHYLPLELILHAADSAHRLESQRNRSPCRDMPGTVQHRRRLRPTMSPRARSTRRPARVARRLVEGERDGLIAYDVVTPVEVNEERVAVDAADPEVEDGPVIGAVGVLRLRENVE